MPDHMPFDEVIRVLEEPALAALAGESARRYVSWDDLTERPLPPGHSAAEVWRLLTALRRMSASWFPIPTLEGEHFWYMLPSEATQCLQVIERHCRSDSLLHRTVLEREGHRFLVRSRIQEAIASCELDGIRLDYARKGYMLQEGRAPQTSEDRLVTNSFRLISELENRPPAPLSPALAWEIYERITEGVDLSALDRGPASTNLAGTRNPDGLLDARGTEHILQTICDYANGVVGDPFEPAAGKGYMLLSAMAYWHPLPDLNGTVARHLLRIFATSHDYPVIGYLPVSLTRRRWEEGQLPPGTVRLQKVERRPDIPGEIDGTPDILTYLQLIVASLEELLAHIETTRAEDEAIQRALESDEDLNYRQRSVLARALGRPDAEFRIRAHQKTHRVVYATARADLLDLEARGFLRRELRGKAFVFVPVPGLRALVFPGTAAWDD